jgi:hypothetical protein
MRLRERIARRFFGPTRIAEAAIIRRTGVRSWSNVANACKS